MWKHCQAPQNFLIYLWLFLVSRKHSNFTVITRVRPRRSLSSTTAIYITVDLRSRSQFVLTSK
ncbi:hypothetical protein CKA32_002630 [Geitlerinema sp. FC II]|nr:hypothetical protein CKA32_002630 [Geitlerinema sp. FC II]